MDGTLVDTEPYWIECEYELVAEHGGVWSDEHAHALVGSDLYDTAAYIRRHGSVDLPDDDIVNRLLDGVIARVRRRVPWRPGARELLKGLRRAGVPCALVTMSWRRLADAVLDTLPPNSFQAVVTGDEVTKGKPDPEPYQRAADLLGLDAHDCVALEDSPTGVRSAVAAGCTVYAIPNVVEIRPGPGYSVVRSLTALDPHRLGVAAGRTRRRRRLVAVAAALGALVVAVTAFAATRPTAAPPPPPPDIPIDAWAPYWALDTSTVSLAAHSTWLRDVSPFWFTVQAGGTIAPQLQTDFTLADTFVTKARRSGIKVIPSIFDGLPAGGMAALLADPTTRAAHVAAIVAFVEAGKYDGIDLDYEQFAFADDRSTWETTSTDWITFLTELAAPLHAAGKTLTTSVPYIYDSERNGDSGFWVYDYAAMGQVVDRIRIMAYDYSTSAPGPIAPIGFVKRAIEAAKAAVDDDSKLVLGVGLHGYNWAVSTVGTCPADGSAGKTSVSQATIADLLDRRGATPVHDPVTQEATFTYEATFTDGTTSCTQTREVHYVDAEGARARIDLARRERLGGAALWALGYDDPSTWAAIGTLATPDPGATTTAGPTADAATATVTTAP